MSDTDFQYISILVLFFSRKYYFEVKGRTDIYILKNSTKVHARVRQLNLGRRGQARVRARARERSRTAARGGHTLRIPASIRISRYIKNKIKKIKRHSGTREAPATIIVSGRIGSRRPADRARGTDLTCFKMCTWQYKRL